jgi:hypothetical protein
MDVPDNPPAAVQMRVGLGTVILLGIGLILTLTKVT